ncbi:4-hydroxy-tetrahydrodipicolinate synthase [Arthrobacter monumenti]
MTGNVLPMADSDIAPGGSLFGSLLTAMVTPMRADGTIDLDETARLADKLVSDGCDGLVVAGTTGESSTLDDEEKVSLFRAVVESVGDRASVIAGTGSNDTAHSVLLSEMAAGTGVDGLLLVTPYYLKPTQSGVQAHFEAVANKTDLPIMLYDIPGRSSVPIMPDTMLRLAEHPQIVAVKDAKADFAAASYVMANSDLVFYSGDDGLTLPWMSLGAAGVVGVTTHLATAQFRQLVDAVRAGDLPTARRIHFELEPAIRAAMTRVPGAVAAKEILSWQGVLPDPTVRLPLTAPTSAEHGLMRADLADAGMELSR